MFSHFLWQFFYAFFLFLKNTFGCLNSPYITYRKLAQSKNAFSSLIFIFFLVFLYFSFSSFLRIGKFHPLLLTLKLNLLFLGAFLGFVLMVFSLYFLGKTVGGEGDWRKIILLWSYSLLPTLFWFFMTSFLSLLFPPPRTLSFLGKIYSLFFISFSLTLFFWKLILYYLTLRFGLKLDFLKILKVSFFLGPVVISYSILMYKLGIFKVPFI